MCFIQGLSPLATQDASGSSLARTTHPVVISARVLDFQAVLATLGACPGEREGNCIRKRGIGPGVVFLLLDTSIIPFLGR